MDLCQEADEKCLNHLVEREKRARGGTVNKMEALVICCV